MNPKLSLCIGILCISFSPIFVKVAGVAPISGAFYRIFVAWLCLLPYCIIKKKLRIERRHLFMAMLAGVLFASDVAVWNVSLLKISATVSTLIANLAPLWVGLFTFFVLKKKVGRPFWIGTPIAIAGMIWLVGPANLLHLQFNTGILLAVLSSIFYASYVLTAKRSRADLDVLQFMFYSMLASGVFLLIICLFTNSPVTGFSPKVWGCFIGMGLVCQLLGWLTINYAIHHMEPTRVSISLLSQTVFTGILAAALLSEHLGAGEIIASVIVLAGIAVTFLKPRQSTK